MPNRLFDTDANVNLIRLRRIERLLSQLSYVRFRSETEVSSCHPKVF